MYATHYLPELAELGATVAVAHAGRIAARGTLDKLGPERLNQLLAVPQGGPGAPGTATDDDHDADAA